VKHKLSTLASALSLLLCATASVFWCRSNFSQTFDAYPEALRGSGCLVQSWDGRVFIQWARATSTARHMLVNLRLPIGVKRAQGARPAHDRMVHEVAADPQSVIWTPFPTEASPPQWPNGFGFTLFAVTPLTSAGRVTLVAIPYWSIVATTGALPIVYLARMLRRRTRNRIGACVRCSYSLTGNTSGVCPECGISIRQQSKVTA